MYIPEEYSRYPLPGGDAMARGSRPVAVVAQRAGQPSNRFEPGGVVTVAAKEDGSELVGLLGPGWD